MDTVDFLDKVFTGHGHETRFLGGVIDERSEGR
jgi:hypothetical protein